MYSSLAVVGWWYELIDCHKEWLTGDLEILTLIVSPVPICLVNLWGNFIKFIHHISIDSFGVIFSDVFHR